VPNLLDDRFEHYLRQFRPLAPERMRFENRLQPRWRPRVLAAWAAFAAVMIVGFMILYPHFRHHNQRDLEGSTVIQIEVPRPLTIRSADALLANAASFEAAVDALAFPSHATSFAVKQSALDVLGKDSKL
jgi:hypothetical protein